MTAAAIEPQNVDLAVLLHGLGALPAPVNMPVTGVAIDHREIVPGDLFIARKGMATDAARFLAQAAQAGAVAAVVDEASVVATAGAKLPVFSLSDLNAVAGIVVHRFFGQPSARMQMVAVTGTNGKTSVSHFVAQCLEPDIACGIVGTLGSGRFGGLTPQLHTTPDILDVQRSLAAFHAAGMQVIVMEASSHGLAQGRLAGIEFDAAVFTNLTRDHLDYHDSEQAYGDAKKDLFRTPGLRAAILNLDDAFSLNIAAELPQSVCRIGYSLNAAGGADLACERVVGRLISQSAAGVSLDITGDFGQGRLEAPVIGAFNGSNLLASLVVLLQCGLSFESAIERLSVCTTPQGRMQIVSAPVGAPLVIVDYAHTPDALNSALAAVRAHCQGDVICVFGCGGDRDAGKRGAMGRIAELLAERIYITDDNPRTEPGDNIVGDVLAGMKVPGQAQVQRDRETAIATALHRAQPKDVVLIAGKGHEQYQDSGGTRRPFSDLSVAAKILRGYRHD